MITDPRLLEQYVNYVLREVKADCVDYDIKTQTLIYKFIDGFSYTIAKNMFEGSPSWVAKLVGLIKAAHANYDDVAASDLFKKESSDLFKKTYGAQWVGLEASGMVVPEPRRKPQTVLEALDYDEQ